eukprot:1143098-Pelagomonas_calceolata.AAC.4
MCSAVAGAGAGTVAVEEACARLVAACPGPRHRCCRCCTAGRVGRIGVGCCCCWWRAWSVAAE